THAYAWKSTHMRGKLPHHVLSHILEEVERDPSLASPFQSHAYAQDSTHMRRRQAPFQLVQGHAHALMQAYAWKTFKPSLSYEDPRIGVEVHAYVWKMQDQAL
ncbi:hypothetical protein PIB30_107404, partial [Stylosanthes scabra]|nr:hypothetical protein [Stylosanthes scabra]